MDAVRREVQAIDPDQPVFSMQTVAQVLAARPLVVAHVRQRCSAMLAAIALVLSSVGLYAVMAYAVTQRTQEIGVRMAVGAQRWQVSWLILKRGLVQLAIGLAIGLAGALVLGRVLRRRDHAGRSGDVRGDRAAPDGRVDRGVPAAGAPRDAGRSGRRAPRGLSR